MLCEQRHRHVLTTRWLGIKPEQDCEHVTRSEDFIAKLDKESGPLSASALRAKGASPSKTLKTRQCMAEGHAKLPATSSVRGSVSFVQCVQYDTLDHVL